KQPSKRPRLLVQHAVVQHSLVSFTDQSRGATQKTAAQPVDVELHDITTLPERAVSSSASAADLLPRAASASVRSSRERATWQRASVFSPSDRTQPPASARSREILWHLGTARKEGA